MKKIYTTITSAHNGTVTISNSVACFTSKELAEEVCQRVELANKDAYFKVYCRVHESVIYESREEVPILNKPIEELQANVTTKEKWNELKNKAPKPRISTEAEEKWLKQLFEEENAKRKREE